MNQYFSQSLELFYFLRLTPFFECKTSICISYELFSEAFVKFFATVCLICVLMLSMQIHFFIGDNFVGASTII